MILFFSNLFLFSNLSILFLGLCVLFLFFVLPIIIIVRSTKESKGNISRDINGQHTLLKYCSHCGSEINEYAVVCLKCGCAINHPKQSNNPLDKPSIGLNILSYFYPLIGLILFLVLKSTPRKANACGKWALIGFIIGLGISFLIILISIMTMYA